MVTILPRSAWTSTPDNRNDPLQVSRVDAITVHYPVGRNTKGWTRGQVAAGLRAIRASHLARTWRDIGYNYAVDQAGRLWHLTGDDVGAHANVVGNTTSIGVVFIVGTTEEPTPELIEAFLEFRAVRLLKFTKMLRVQGHQQVPGNSTACPGVPIMRLVRSGALTKRPGTPIAAPSTDRMDPAAYFIGATGNHVTWLGERLTVHGFGAAYNAGPGPNFTEADRLNVAAFQRAQGWTGDDADGFPGAQTLAILAADPAPVPAPLPPTAEPVPAPEPGPAPSLYTVRAGDTLLSIARAHDLTLAQLLDLNSFSDIAPGDALAVSKATTPTPSPDPSPTPKPDPVPETPVNTNTYFRILSINQYADQYTGGKRAIGPQQAVYNDAAPSVAMVTEVNRDTDHERWMTICGGWPKVYAIRAKRNNHLYFQQGTWEYVAATEKLLGSITPSAGTNQNRGATFVLLRHKASGLLQPFVVTHLSSATSGYTRAEADRSQFVEATNLMKFVNSEILPGWIPGHAIIGADLNGSASGKGTARSAISDTHGFLRDHGVKVTNAGIKSFQGWPNPNPWKQGDWLDDIASGKDITLHSARLIASTRGCSDHLGLVATHRRTNK